MQFSQAVNMHIFLDALGQELDELTQALEDLQNKRSKNDEKDVPEDIQTADKIHLAYVASVGYSEAEEVDEVES